jgi:carboxylesterase
MLSLAAGWTIILVEELPLVMHINSHGYNCAVLLLRGHGKDGLGLSGLTYADWLQQSIDFCSHYKSSYKKVYVVGFSMGATLSLHVAKDVGVDGVVSIVSYLSPPDIMRKILGLSKAAN